LIWDGNIQIQDPRSGRNIPYLIFENLLYKFFGLKILKFFDADPDPGWKKSDPGPRIQDPR
jgi:hypothetical protein